MGKATTIPNATIRNNPSASTPNPVTAISPPTDPTKSWAILAISGEARRVHALVEIVEAPLRQRAELRRAGVLRVGRSPAARRDSLEDARCRNAPAMSHTIGLCEGWGLYIAQPRRGFNAPVRQRVDLSFRSAPMNVIQVRSVVSRKPTLLRATPLTNGVRTQRLSQPYSEPDAGAGAVHTSNVTACPRNRSQRK